MQRMRSLLCQAGKQTPEGEQDTEAKTVNSENTVIDIFFRMVGITTIVAFSSSIPFEKSIFGIGFGFTILLNIYCMICVTISDDGINRIRKLNRYIPIF